VGKTLPERARLDNRLQGWYLLYRHQPLDRSAGMTLDLSSYRKAVASLEALLARTTDDGFMARLDEVGQQGMRAGVIQHFEFTYELAWKFVRRWIAINRSPEQADPRSRKDLFRLAAREGLVADPEPWFEYGEARNLTSHTYDEATAERIYAVAVRFVADARDLLARLEAAND
jgi:nucleotidyltransferase substrate binding protein (TIGR01987 family)